MIVHFSKIKVIAAYKLHNESVPLYCGLKCSKLSLESNIASHQLTTQQLNDL